MAKRGPGRDELEFPWLSSSSLLLDVRLPFSCFFGDSPVSSAVGDCNNWGIFVTSTAGSPSLVIQGSSVTLSFKVERDGCLRLRKVDDDDDDDVEAMMWLVSPSTKMIRSGNKS